MEDTDLEDTRLSMQAVVNKTSSQNEIGRLACVIIDLTIFDRVLLFWSTTSYCCGLWGIDNCLAIPFSSHHYWNWLEWYSLPPSVYKALILVLNIFSTICWKFLKQLRLHTKNCCQHKSITSPVESSETPHMLLSL